jgi:signal transduction histidine kinase
MQPPHQLPEIGQSPHTESGLTRRGRITRYPDVFWHSLMFKITVSTALVLLLVMGSGFWFLVQRERQYEFKQAENYSTRVAELVIQSFDRSASNQRPFHSRYLAQKLLSLPQVHNLRVVAPDGTIQFSRDPLEINTKLDLTNHPTCKDCHKANGLSSYDRTYTGASGEALFHFPFSIPNSQSCLRCHRAEFKTLGTLIVETEIDSINAKIKKTRDAISITVLISLVLSLLGTVWMIQRLVKRPLDDLRREMRKVEKGDFSIAASPETQDELREVYESFGSMTRRLADVQQHLNTMLEDKSATVDDLSQELRRIYGNLIRMEHLSAVGTLSSQVVHEIRTPLNALSLNLQLLNQELSDHVDLSEGAVSLAQNIGHEVERITVILEKFLNRARRPLSPPTETSLQQIVRNVIMLMELESKKANVRFDTNLFNSGEKRPLRGDELVQILINLITNAIQAMPDGGVLGIETQEDEVGISISISDTGIGVPDDNLEKIFSPFFTTRPNGTGLGLAIVQRLVVEMGGTIRVEARPEGGTIFTLNLPWPGIEERESV